MAEFDVPGIQMTYVRGARLLHTACFGEADHRPAAPVQADNVFRFAGNAMPFTATGILLLAERGQLRLQDRVFAPDGLLPQFSRIGPQREWLHAVTVQQLLTHTCGGWSSEERDPMLAQPGFNQTQLIAWTLRRRALQYPPGERYAPSNFGYCVLGRIIERVSGVSYARFMEHDVLRPAGIGTMRVAGPRSAPREVRYYGQGGERPYAMSLGRMDAAAGWVGNAADMARLLASLFSPLDNEGAPRVLNAASLRVMTTPSTANPGMACGLAVNAAGNAWHTGQLPGSTSVMVHAPSRVAWAAVTNTRSRKPDAVARLDNLLWQVARSVPEWEV